MNRRRVSLRTRLNILIAFIILAVSMVLMITGYRAYCRKVDEFCYARVKEAAVTVSRTDGSLAEDLWNAVNTDEFRRVRERAIAANG